MNESLFIKVSINIQKNICFRVSPNNKISCASTFIYVEVSDSAVNIDSFLLCVSRRKENIGINRNSILIQISKFEKETLFVNIYIACFMLRDRNMILLQAAGEHR